MKELKVKIHTSTIKGGESYNDYTIKVGDLYKNFKTLKTYRVVEIKEEEGKVKLEGIETRNLTTTIKALTTNYYLEEEVKEEESIEEEVKEEESIEEVEEEVKEEEVKEENKKTLVEEALEEAGLSSKLGKIGEKVEEESIEDPIEETIEETIEESKELEPEPTKDPIEESIEDPIEESKEDLEAYIEDNKRDIILGKEVLVLKKDFSTLKGKIVSIGDFTFKLLVDNKEEIIFFKDLIGTYSKDIDFNKLSNYLTSIKNIRPSSLESKVKKPNKDINTKKVTKKDKEEGIITLRDIIEEIVREKLLILDLEYNPNNTFKNIRKKIRKRGELTKSLRLEGYTYSFRIENKNLIKEELLKILA